MIQGRKKDDVLYSFRIFQSMLLLASEFANREEELDLGLDLDPDLDMDMNMDDLESIPDDLDIQLDDLEIDTDLDAIGSSDSFVMKTAFTTSLSIFLSALYHRDPALFTW